jgi:hypothetical protein
MTESSTLANLATHFCAEFTHDDLNPEVLVSLFAYAPVKQALAKSSDANDFVVKARAAKHTTSIAVQVEALCTVVTNKQDAYIKLRSMNLTQQLMEAMPPGVRESINRMTSQLLQSIGPPPAPPLIAAPPASPTSVAELEPIDCVPAGDMQDIVVVPAAVGVDSSPIVDDVVRTPAAAAPSPVVAMATSPAQMLSSIMQSGMFQEMSDMMKTEMDDQLNITDKMLVLEEKVNLIWDRVERLEKRGGNKRGGKRYASRSE